jgi:hypothetical protein
VERTLETSTALSGSGTAAFVLTMGTLDLCPSRWTVEPLSATACLRGELGVLHGQGRDVTPPKEQSPLWMAVDGLVRGELALFGPLSIAMTAGLRVPLVRTRYFFRPDTTVFRPPAIGSLGGIELVVRFL